MEKWQSELFLGSRVQILEMVLKNEGDKLDLSLEILCKNAISRIVFYNVSRFRINTMSLPLYIDGFEIINHSQSGWEKESMYEIRDYEQDCINFFCEYLTIDDD